MRVLLVSSSFPRFPGDATAAAGHNKLDLVVELGRHVEGTLLTPAQPGAPNQERIGGILVRRVRPRRPREALHHAVRGPQAIRVGLVAAALRRAARACAPAHDVAHGFWAFPGGWAVAGCGLPAVVTFPGPDAHLVSRSRLMRVLVSHVARAARVCVAIDPVGRAVLDGTGAARVEEIPSGINLDDFPLAPPATGETLLYVGRLAHEKGVDLLLDAFGIARRVRPGLSLLVVGEGSMGRRLKRQARASGIGEAITFVGAVPRGELPTLLAGCRAVVVPSRLEGLSTAAIEALGAGRPVVATRVGGLPSVLGERGGVLVSPEDVPALADGLLEVTSRRWDPGALRESVARFDVRAVACRYLDLYSSVTGVAAPSGEMIP